MLIVGPPSIESSQTARRNQIVYRRSYAVLFLMQTKRQIPKIIQFCNSLREQGLHVSEFRLILVAFLAPLHPAAGRCNKNLHGARRAQVCRNRMNPRKAYPMEHVILSAAKNLGSRPADHRSHWTIPLRCACVFPRSFVAYAPQDDKSARTTGIDIRNRCRGSLRRGGKAPWRSRSSAPRPSSGSSLSG